MLSQSNVQGHTAGVRRESDTVVPMDPDEMEVVSADVSPLEFRRMEAVAAPLHTFAVQDRAVMQQMAEQVRSLEERLSSENESMKEMLERVRKEAYREGQRAAEQQMQQKIQEARQEIARLASLFGAEKERYFLRVEREVVRLALAIATRVLHREAQMDPLLLAGVVRVAIEKLADTSGLVLRTPPGEVMAWQEMFRLTGEARVQPEVIGDLSLRAGECVLETRLGTVEVGVRAQMEEIEKGFFDLLEQRPRGLL